MYYSAMAKLNRRRKGLLEEGEQGFTLIELLVVVIIIGILAAIAIPVYLGVQANAKNSNVESDVVNLKTAVVSLETNAGGTLPDSLAGVTTLTQTWKDAGATLGGDTTSLSYYPVGTTDPSKFCVEAVSNDGTTTYAADQSTGAEKGTCSTAGVLTAAN